MRKLVLLLLLTAVPVSAATVKVEVKPTPRPAQKSDEVALPPMDMTRAIPGAALSKLPSSAEQLGALKEQLARDKPRLEGAKEKSQALADEAKALREKLIATARRISDLERQTISLDTQIASLQSQNDALTAGFARDRISVTRLLAILQRLQHDMPPALAVRPDDALAAARGAMLVGAGLPPLYEQAAQLAARINKLKSVRSQLAARRADGATTAAALTVARAELETLSAQKDREAEDAAGQYGNLKKQLDEIAASAANFQALVTRIADLRRAGPGTGEPSMVTVKAENGRVFALTKGSLLHPVVGKLVPPQSEDGPENVKNTGITFVTAAKAQVIAPADGKVLFAGSWHRSGQVLILETATGYDLVLAGMGRVTVRPNDQLLAGEPVGMMDAGSTGRLYFELRQGGHSLDPAPWLGPATLQEGKTR